MNAWFHRIRPSAWLALALLFCSLPGFATAADKPLRIIVFGAHPDDAEFKTGGTAIKWARQGHQVKLVSVTNGDIGHWQMAGGTARSAADPRSRGGGQGDGDHVAGSRHS